MLACKPKYQRSYIYKNAIYACAAVFLMKFVFFLILVALSLGPFSTVPTTRMSTSFDEKNEQIQDKAYIVMEEGSL